MKKIPTSIKLFITGIFLLSLVYAIVNFFVDTPISNYSETKHYILMISNLIILVFLISRVFKFNTDKETKILWCCLLIFFSPSILYYLWYIDDKQIKNEN